MKTLKKKKRNISLTVARTDRILITYTYRRGSIRCINFISFLFFALDVCRGNETATRKHI